MKPTTADWLDLRSRVERLVSARGYRVEVDILADEPQVEVRHRDAPDMIAAVARGSGEHRDALFRVSRHLEERERYSIGGDAEATAFIVARTVREHERAILRAIRAVRRGPQIDMQRDNTNDAPKSDRWTGT